MSNARKKILDALEGLSDDGDDSDASGSGSGDGGGGGGGGDGDGAGSDADADAAPGPSKKPKTLTLDDLEAQGFTTGPSVLYMKPPAEEPQSWNWGDGRAQKAAEPEEETQEERERTREAATTGAEQGALLAMRAAAHSAKLRDEAKEERARLAAEKQLTWNQKEKRKRATGQATKGKNYVEEEKRLARNFGMYSGFD
ncbi:hypothetical protein Rsub_07427 [Raphidocelis subcapitata]|uniref:Uncharacterized protein n=1 Tax=Raphidocelis subcapitata TaxID=307507 RepID=A0A2V0P488_9CHLO|nr:hypothetical protein Rsub_07427 [Raphidocelis subcapitata]|eukprot:GBF94691.1 hypothetical protein Rsub_07427 [Raphidocelis subcapitata]